MVRTTLSPPARHPAGRPAAHPRAGMAAALLGVLVLVLALGCGGGSGGGAAGTPYPDPGAFPALRGPGGPAVEFSPGELFQSCAFLDGGPTDLFDHHNLVVFFDGYLLMPWAPEWGIGGLTLFDVSDPCNPSVAGAGTSPQMRETHSIGFSLTGGPWAVVDQISTPLLSLEGGIELWDLSDSAAPVPVSRLPLPGFLYPDAYARVTLSTFWQAPYVYAAAADNGVFIVDASDPLDPVVVGQHRFRPVLRAGQVHAVGNLLVVTTAEGARTALLDISDPASPRPIPGGDFLATDRDGVPREAYFTNLVGGHVYYARKDGGGGVIVYDVRDPSNPTFAGDLRSDGNGGYVFVKDGFAFVGESRFAAMYDVRDPAAITEVARFELQGDLDTLTPIGNVAFPAVDDEADRDKGTAAAPFATDVDRDPPEVTWSVPGDGDSNLAATSRIGVTFSELVEPRSVWEGSVRLYVDGTDPASTRVDGYLSAQEVIVNFWPAEPLEPGTRYRFEIPAGGVVDVNGNPVAETFSIAFTTAGETAVEAVTAGDLVAEVGETVTLDGSGSSGATTFVWDLGDGRSVEAGGDPVIAVAYDEPGRYQAVLSALDEAGNRDTASVGVTVLAPRVHEPSRSGTVAVLPGPRLRVAVVEPDAGEVTIVEKGLFGDRFAVAGRIRTADDPRTVTAHGDWLVVPCQDADRVELHRHDLGGASFAVELPFGSRPYGAAAIGDDLYVTLQATGEVARIHFDGSSAPTVLARYPVIADARGIAALPDRRLAVTRWRSPDDRGEVGVLDPETGAVETWTLALDPQISSDTEIGGIPSYLDDVLVSPTGTELALPSLQVNVLDGVFRNGRAPTFETALRAVVSYVDPAAGAERFEQRKQFDNRGFASAGAYSSRGDYLFLAMRGSRTVERIDRLNGGAQAGSIPGVGLAPDGLALSPDDRFLFAHAGGSRELVVYDVTSFDEAPEALARLATVTEEPLSPQVLRGLQLFGDTFDTRLAKDGYLTCAHCHLDGLTDRRTWDFTDRGEGLRQTITLRGRAGLGDGPVHWSANFDEIQDFENDIRAHFGGRGLMSDADFAAGTTADPLGDPKAGKSADLDALAAYVSSLDTAMRSPYRDPTTGALRPAARRGKAIFEDPAVGCTECHSGPRLTDSAMLDATTPLLHDVGTIGPGSGGRRGEPLTGLDTPTLHGLWDSGPYLHDGSAPTLREVLVDRNPDDRHGVTSGLGDAELDDLVAYLRALDGRLD